MKSNIFQYIDPIENTKLSELSPKEVKHLFSLLKHYQLEMRPTLDLPQIVTFGVEIEFGCPNTAETFSQLKQELEQCDKNWKLEEEVTNYGLEATSDILTNKKKTWKTIKKVCELISKYGVESSLSGGHVHIGAHLLQRNDDCYTFVKLLTAYENLLYRFGYGEYLNAKSRLWYAKPMSAQWEEALQMKNESFYSFVSQTALNREQSVNLKAFFNQYQSYQNNNTIEFRFPNGTLNPIIWQNNINVFSKMMLYVQNGSINHDLLDARILNNHKLKPIVLKFNDRKQQFPLEMQNIQEYEKVDIEEALEFSDLIFNNNLDKIYFLKQYYKNGKTSKKNFQKVKNLTK